MNPRLFDQVRLECDLPDYGLTRGQLGTIVNVHLEQHVCLGGVMSSAAYVICSACGRKANHMAYDVEFLSPDGLLCSVARVTPDQVQHLPELSVKPDPARLQRLLRQGLGNPQLLQGAGAFVGNLLATVQSLDEVRNVRNVTARVLAAKGSYAEGYKRALADVAAAFEDALTGSV